MSGEKRGKCWTMGTLKNRGWTEALVKELLPKPRRGHANGYTLRLWKREDVLKQEETERFRTASAQVLAEKEEQKRQTRAQRDRELAGAAALLEAAWAAVPEADSLEYRLGEAFHQAILKHISDWTGDCPRPGQAIQTIEGLLKLESRYGQRFDLLKGLAPAGYWLGRVGEGHPTAVRLKGKYGTAILKLARHTLADYEAGSPQAGAEQLLGMDKFPKMELLSHPLSYIYSVYYVPRAIRTSLELLVALNPKDEYPAARAMSRHFFIHVGGTNTGKTYAGFQRLIAAHTGVYLAPLRLLALEAQESLLDAGVNCALSTGEEEDWREGDTHVAATAEKLEMNRDFHVAVIDECQMIADMERGYAWTRAILGVRAPEVHLCCAPEAKGLLVRLIESCGDSYEIVEHRRKTPLVCMSRQIDYSQVEPGDALITFSKVGVLSVAEDLRQQGKEPAIIYGALPYSTRRKQVEGFLSGRMKYVVSTDAIGMGLNLPIRRIIFMDTNKFDGKETRPLKPAEIQQIAGRAGRYGMYDKGYVGATDNLSAIRAGLNTVVPPLQYAVVGFPDLVLQVDFDLLEVLDVWNRMPTVDPYVKMDVSRYIFIITRLREKNFQLTKEQELRAASIPFDENDETLRHLFYKLLRQCLAGEEVERPALPLEGKRTLPELEEHCRKLDLYFSFAKAFSCQVDQEALYEERESVADQINSILLHNLKNNIRFCAKCGAALPLHNPGRLCQSCYQKKRSGFWLQNQYKG